MKSYVKFSTYELVFQRFPINLISENPLKLMFGTKNMRNHRGYLILFSGYLKNSHTHEFFGRPVLSYQKNDLFWIFGDLKSKKKVTHFHICEDLFWISNLREI